jgi:rhamnulokinase
MASTFQLYNPRARGWSEKLIQAHGFPRSLFPELAESATILGALRKDIGLEGTRVIATCSHDTGAAVAGVPAVDNENWAYLSSGTWSLMGVELDAPIINNSAREMNFTNEIGYGNRVRFLKNLSGLWLVQECRRAWAEQGEQWEYARLAELARDAAPFRSLIDPAAPEFLAPASMPAQIASFCRRTGQPEVRRPGEFVRCILESLALLYRHTLRQMEELIGRRMGVMQIVGGGSNNDLLNQFTANALGIPVLAGPAEATAAGNIVLQAIALGHLSSLEAAREVIRNSCTLRRFEPRDGADWDRGYRQFMQVRELDSARRGAPETSGEPA